MTIKVVTVGVLCASYVAVMGAAAASRTYVFDVAVVGGGPAGIGAALAGAKRVRADAKEGQPFVGTTGWIAQSYEFTAGPESNVQRPSYLSIDLREATGTIWVDDVRLDEVD